MPSLPLREREEDGLRVQVCTLYRSGGRRMGRWSRQFVVTVSVEPDDPSVVGRTGSYRSLDGLARFAELEKQIETLNNNLEALN